MPYRPMSYTWYGPPSKALYKDWAPAPVKKEPPKLTNEFMVGADPEFMLLDETGKTVSATLFFPEQGVVGYDHQGRVAEFRPAAARSTYQIAKQLHALINGDTVKKANKRLRAGALCNGDCLGGHVHFGFSPFKTKPLYPAFSSLQGGQLNDQGAKVAKALDALTYTLEKLDILPRIESASRRASSQGQLCHYGAYGDVRDCNGHMEYRTMASWLHDPKVAYLVLTAAKLAAAHPVDAYEILKDCESFDTFKAWVERYKEKDFNAKRAVEKLLDGGLPHLQVDPTVDFRERWKEFPL